MIAATYAALACGFLLGVPFGYWLRHAMGRTDLEADLLRMHRNCVRERA